MTEIITLETPEELLRIRREKILRDIEACKELEHEGVQQVITALLIRKELEELLLDFDDTIELLEELL